MNVSPTGNGQIQSEQLELLQLVEAWMAVYAQSIVGTQPGLEPWQFYGPSTRRGDRFYLFLLMKPYDSVNGQFEAPPKRGTPEALESLRDAIAKYEERLK